MPGAKQKASALRAIAPAAMALRKQTSCSRATDVAGGQSLEFVMNVKARPQIVVVTDAAALAETAARRLIARVTRGDRAAVCLTGGSSPLGLYRLLAQHPWREQVPWDRVHWFMGDDRFVPEREALSNMGAAKQAFLDSAPVPRQNIHSIATEASYPEAAARRYEDELKQFYGADRLDAGRPLFDLVLMGLGPD